MLTFNPNGFSHNPGGPQKDSCTGLPVGTAYTGEAGESTSTRLGITDGMGRRVGTDEGRMVQESRQIGLWESDGDARTASMVAGLIAAVRAGMAQAATRSHLSRPQLVDRINAIAGAAGVRLTKGNGGKAISGDTLDKWLNPGALEHAPGLLAINVICLALGDPGPILTMLALHGLEAMTPEDRKLLDYGRAMAQQRKARKTLRKIEEDLP